MFVLEKSPLSKYFSNRIIDVLSLISIEIFSFFSMKSFIHMFFNAFVIILLMYISTYIFARIFDFLLSGYYQVTY